MNTYNHTISAQDVLAALGFEAKRLSCAVDQHAAGYLFPDPREMKVAIERIAHLNNLLISFLHAEDPKNTLKSSCGMSVELN
jgi:hypothetical protein